MVFTIHRYIFYDLLRYFALGALVLSLVLGFGFMLRPLQQFSVDPARVPALMLYTLPITLSMVLPVAGLLATTLVYGRLAGDNEINACRSSGISIATLIYPAFTLALLVGVSTLMLSFHVIPDFIARFENTLKSDAETMIFRNIQKNGSLGHFYSGMRIYADRTDQDQKLLSGVAVVDLDKKDTIVTAKQVRVNVVNKQGNNFVQLHLVRPQGVMNGRDIGSFETFGLGIEVPDLFRDKIKFKKLHELKAIQEDLTKFAPINDLLQQVHHQYIVERFFEVCHQSLRQRGFVEITAAGGRRVKIHADRMYLPEPGGQNRKRPARLQTACLEAGEPGTKIKIDYYRSPEDTNPTRIEAGQARLNVDSEGELINLAGRDDSISIHIDLAEAEIMPGSVRQELYRIPAIAVPVRVVEETQHLTIPELMQNGISLSYHEPSAYLQWLVGRLRDKSRMLQVEIQVDKHSRLALGVSCVVLVLMGAALGIRFRSSHLLTAFGVGFIPAAVCMLTISTGKQLAEQHPENILGGILFLWAGIFLVIISNFWLYRTLLRN